MPLRIIGFSDHVKPDMVGDHHVQEIPGFLVLAATGNMQHDINRRIDIIDPGYARFEKGGERVHIPRIAIRPKNAVIDFIAHLYHVRQGALFLQGQQHAFCIFPDSLGELVKVVPLPCRRFKLLARVRPGIAVMKVQQQLQARCFYSFCHGLGMFQVAEPFCRRIAAVRRRVIKDAQPDIVEPVILQYLNSVFLHPIIRELHAPGFELGQERNVRPQHFPYGSFLCHFSGRSPSRSRTRSRTRAQVARYHRRP